MTHFRATNPLALSAKIAMVAGCMLLSACAVSDPKAEAAAAAAAESAADQSGAPMKLARAARDVGDYSSAIELFKQTALARPADMSVLAELGGVQLQAGKIYDAIDTFGKIPSNSPLQLDAQLGLERAYLMLADVAQALDHADKAVAIAPQEARALVGDGVALDMARRHPEAQAAYRKALAIAPHDIGAVNDLALSLALTGKFDEAIALLTPVARDPSATARVRQNLALIYGLKGDTAAARTLNRQDLDEQTTDNNLAFYQLARQHIGM